MLVAGSDRTINPDLERWYATVYISHQKEVAALIEKAATHAH